MDYNQQCLYRPIQRFTFMDVTLANSINTETNKSVKILRRQILRSYQGQYNERYTVLVRIDKDF